MASVCVDIDLEDVRTSDLIDELHRRRKLDKNDLMDMSPEGLIDMLEHLGCPQSLIKEIEAWARQPVPNIHKLMAWKEACIDSNCPK